jgi:hypothetical protein
VVQWLNMMLFIAAGVDFVLASVSCVSLWDLARRARTRARQVGASALAVVCGSLASEAVLFLALATSTSSWPWLLATALVRSVLLCASSSIALLLWRNGWSRR